MSGAIIQIMTARQAQEAQNAKASNYGNMSARIMHR